MPERSERFAELDREIAQGRGDATPVKPQLFSLPPNTKARQRFAAQPRYRTREERGFFTPSMRKTMNRILDFVAGAYQLDPVLLRASASHARKWSHPRALVCYLARQTTDFSYPEIARFFSMDHSSVMYSVKMVRQKVEESGELRALVQTLLKKLEKSL
jgi:hypothetical protein